MATKNQKYHAAVIPAGTWMGGFWCRVFNADPNKRSGTNYELHEQAQSPQWHATRGKALECADFWESIEKPVGIR
jgi:hypothetical protein